LKRSNRLVLLIGVFLAIVAFAGILVLVRNPSTGEGGPVKPPTTGPVVVAAEDIPLSALISADQVTTKTVELTAINSGAFLDVSQVIGQIARQPVKTGGQITSTTLSGGDPGVIKTIDCPHTFRCMSVQVDQVSGVGTVIKTGDYVDMVVGLTGDKTFPVILPSGEGIQIVAGLSGTSVHLLLQGLQVVGTLLPPVESGTTTGATASAPPAPGGTGTALNGQQEIVIVAASAQQAEILKFAQMDGNVTLALRSASDFVDPVTGALLPPVTTQTTGVNLKTLVDSYGVLPSEIVQILKVTETLIKK